MFHAQKAGKINGCLVLVRVLRGRVWMQFRDSVKQIGSALVLVKEIIGLVRLRVLVWQHSHFFDDGLGCQDDARTC